MQILVAELAEFENGILRCLLVGGLRDMPFSDQVSLEGDEVVGVDLQVAADARLACLPSEAMPTKSPWC